MIEQHKTRIKELHSLINHHNKNYYDLDINEISDAEYDKLYQELEQLELTYPDMVTETSPTKRIGGTVSTEFMSVKHDAPMLSLKTVTDYTDQGAIDFYEKVKKELCLNDVEYVGELKYDGLGIDLKYEKGILVRALTRGDGVEGEDVTHNVMQIKDIRHKLIGPYATAFDTLNVRGEIYMRRSVMQALNDKSTRKFANARNAAAGSIRQLDSNITRHRRLSFFPYSIPVFTTELKETPTTHFDWLKLLSSLGFKINEHTKLMNSAEELANYHNEVEQLRSVLDYDIDGVVYKVNNLVLQDQLGFISTEPKWAIAHKFLAEQKTTEVLSIDIQVGRTGKLTPVAKVRPIHVAGTTISSITLHNEEETNRKDVRVGDTVTIQRAGDVIPEIVGIVLDTSKVRSEPFKMPDVCPSCGTPVVKPVDQTDHRCPNTEGCPDQNKSRITHFVQRKAVEVEGLGEKLVEQLIEEGHVKTSADLFCLGAREKAKAIVVPLTYYVSNKSKEELDKLAYSVLISLDRMADKSAKNILSALEAAKQTTLEKFIYALGIRNAGEGTAKRLVRSLGSLDNIRNATVEQLSEIDDIGPIVAKSVFDYFQSRQNNENIELLLKLGVTFKQEDMNNKILDGINVVITGSFSTVKRSDAENTLKQFGANVQSNVGKTTHTLFCGENVGTKLAEATKLGINICHENDLRLAITNPTSWKSLYVRQDDSAERNT